MNYGYADLDKFNYPTTPKNLIPSHLEWYYQANLYIYLLSLIPPRYGNILDIGCGNGGGTSVYKEYYSFNNIVGIDINKSFIEYCKLKHPNIKYIQGDILSAHIPGNFDVITGIQVIENFNHSFEILFSFFKKIKSLLSSNGILILTAHQYKNTDNFALFKKTLKKNKLNILKEIDISMNVLYSLNIDLLKFKDTDKGLYEITRKALKDIVDSTYKVFVINNI